MTMDVLLFLLAFHTKKTFPPWTSKDDDDTSTVDPATMLSDSWTTLLLAIGFLPLMEIKLATTILPGPDGASPRMDLAFDIFLVRPVAQYRFLVFCLHAHRLSTSSGPRAFLCLLLMLLAVVSVVEM